MNLPGQILDPVWYTAGWVGLAAGSIICAPRWLSLRAWAMFGNGPRVNLWLGGVVILSLLWQFRAGFEQGAYLHLLGAQVLVLAVGAPMAALGLLMALAATVLNGKSDADAFGLNATLLCFLPVAFAVAWDKLVWRFLPHHLFVYIFMNGFFGSAFSMIGTGVVAASVMALSGAFNVLQVKEVYLPFVFLLSFSEAWLSGMMVTLMVVFRPEWVESFDDREYLKKL